MSSAEGDESKSFAQRLAALIRERGLSQKSFAASVGVSPATVVKWLSKGSLPRSSELYRVAKFFGRPMEWFLDGVEDVAYDRAVMQATQPDDLSADQWKALLRKMNMKPEQFFEGVQRVEQFRDAIADALDSKGLKLTIRTHKKK